MKNVFGKYKAIVVNNTDDKNMGRIKVKCPQIYGESESPWCLPCLPLVGAKRGMFSIPNINDTVWIEFEEGDTLKPIYVGGWWTQNNVPVNDNGIESFISKSGHSIIFNNKLGEESITIYEKSGNKIIIDTDGVKINDNFIINTAEVKINFDLVLKDGTNVENAIKDLYEKLEDLEDEISRL